MAVDSYDATTGRPIFLDSGAPDVGVDPTAVGIYAADVGNRVVRANKAALDSYAYKRNGLMGHALDTGFDYVCRGGSFVLIGGALSARMKRSATAKSITNTSINQDLSANNLWVEDWRDAGIATYNNGWVIPVSGEWEIDFGGQFSGAADLFISVNKSSLATFADVSGFAQGVAGSAAVALPQGSKRLRLTAGAVIRIFGASVPGSVSWDNTNPGMSWFGIKFISN